MGEESIKKYQ